MYCTLGTECLSHTPGSHSVCASDSFLSCIISWAQCRLCGFLVYCFALSLLTCTKHVCCSEHLASHWKLNLDVKIEESEKAGSRQELKLGHLWLEPPVLCHLALTAGQPPTLTILYMYCTDGTECLSGTPVSHSVCAVRTRLVVDWKILSIRKEPMLSCFLTLIAQSILPHTGNKML